MTKKKKPGPQGLGKQDPEAPSEVDPVIRGTPTEAQAAVIAKQLASELPGRFNSAVVLNRGTRRRSPVGVVRVVIEAIEASGVSHADAISALRILGHDEPRVTLPDLYRVAQETMQRVDLLYGGLRPGEEARIFDQLADQWNAARRSGPLQDYDGESFRRAFRTWQAKEAVDEEWAFVPPEIRRVLRAPADTAAVQGGVPKKRVKRKIGE